MLGLLFAILKGFGLAQNVEIVGVEAFDKPWKRMGSLYKKVNYIIWILSNYITKECCPLHMETIQPQNIWHYFVPPASGYKVGRTVAEIARALGITANVTFYLESSAG